MDENSAIIEAILKEEEEEAKKDRRIERKDDDAAYAWQTVSYQKRKRKPSKPPVPETIPDLPNGSGVTDVFRSVEQRSEERRRRAMESRREADAVGDTAVAGSKRHSDGADTDDEEASAAQNGGGGEVEKAKVKKPKKPKVTVAEAASKIKVVDLEAFLAEITASYESKEDVQLMRFADYFGRAFASVNAAQFPWLKTFKESTVTKLVDIPLSHISGDVYKTSVDWIGHRSPEALRSFVLWLLDSILADLASHQGTVKGSKKVAKQAPSKSQVNLGRIIFCNHVVVNCSVWCLDVRGDDMNMIIMLGGRHEVFGWSSVNEMILMGRPVYVAWMSNSWFTLDVAYAFNILNSLDLAYPNAVAIFVVLAMTLRRKPDVLISLLPVMRETSKYQGHDKLPVAVWSIAQASQGDLIVGLYMWVHLLLPLMGSRSSCNPQSRDLILQLVESILSTPKSRPILLNGAVRKGERLVPPSSLDLLMRITFPAPSARVKATERFEAVYPLLKEIALAGSPESKAMKQVIQQILNFLVKAIEEEIPELSKEASDIFIWCLKRNSECYKQWDMLYLDNLKASVVILSKLNKEWKQFTVKHARDPLNEILKSLKQKNARALAEEEDSGRCALLKDAELDCKMLYIRINNRQIRKKFIYVLCGFLVVSITVKILSLPMFGGYLQKS
ncbi:hypothetical protein FEM48_Zijuj04G0169500 [Ziziphus jujuba var. spinosa]|uniref:Uncharacterized protein n=1 Tax=Ziziphus jujuba var. spinosa TaxID=714518 RepID=A0A978VL24_ZIZJJ|nr:hypothetical protein FEM48_Zijuj04G0169500 [Ziziphus jujuba var. spinosa]